MIMTAPSAKGGWHLIHQGPSLVLPRDSALALSTASLPTHCECLVMLSLPTQRWVLGD
ncbi:hypothetical protein HYDPIDRAFT_119494 [Hydnomerulius pinastri MD-312]|uniref:Uncharacterized protein n=1 Tax=Hydnomerulius pinastri MD-312 TaxID=994086 RepID=A0A0C9W7M1_9AGAM|nr:hypothetical protein HYDPIDRAFT_119494 [Hydnomerulius pinastri MD-312]